MIKKGSLDWTKMCEAHIKRRKKTMTAGIFAGLLIATIFALTTFRYTVEDTRLEIFFLGIKMRSIPYEDITDFRQGWGIAAGQQYLCGRLSMYWKKEIAVTIFVKKGFNLVITPENPGDFLDKLRAKCGKDKD
jgi:hypothetical protein